LLFVTIIITIVIIFSLSLFFFLSEGGCFLQQPQPPRFKPRNFHFQ
jgi:hypothetical protein